MSSRWIAVWILGGCVAAAGIQANGALIVEAVRTRDAAQVQALIRQKVDLNAAEPDGTTALHWAAHANDAAMVQQLLRGGARPNVANVYGITPLALACLNASSIIVDALLKSGADPNIAATSGETPLMTAARTGNVDVVKALIEARAVVTAREVTGQTALMWAAAGRHTSVVRELIRAGAAVDAVTDGNRFTALLFAARSGDVASAEALLAAGAALNYAGADQRDALIIAAASNHLPMVNLLLDRGADPNVTDRSGATPLHAAVWGNVGNVEMIQRLLAAGAYPNYRTTRPMPQRRTYGYNGDIFYRTPASLQGATPIALAAAQCDLDALRALAAGGADIAIPLDNGSTPLMLSAGLGWNFERSNVTYEQALAATQVTLDLGGDVHARNKGGRTAMHGAANQGAAAVLRLLVARGADINALDTDGWTPLWTAQHAYVGASVVPHPQAITVLRELGAADIPATIENPQAVGAQAQ